MSTQTLSPRLPSRAPSPPATPSVAALPAGEVVWELRLALTVPGGAPAALSAATLCALRAALAQIMRVVLTAVRVARISRVPANAAFPPIAFPEPWASAPPPCQLPARRLLRDSAPVPRRLQSSDDAALEVELVVNTNASAWAQGVTQQPGQALGTAVYVAVRDAVTTAFANASAVDAAFADTVQLACADAAIAACPRASEAIRFKVQPRTAVSIAAGVTKSGGDTGTVVGAVVGTIALLGVCAVLAARARRAGGAGAAKGVLASDAPQKDDEGAEQATTNPLQALPPDDDDAIFAGVNPMAAKQANTKRAFSARNV